MSRSEALVIWILRIAMKAPIMPASTAIQAVMLALSAARGAGAGKDRPTAANEAALDMSLLLQ